MTKERRLAIEMWELIAASLAMEQSVPVSVLKDSFCRSNKLKWRYNCWFCQYVRQDYRYNLKSRRCIDVDVNGCCKCPLYKYIQSRFDINDSEDICGCSDYSHSYPSLWNRAEDGDIEAARLIIYALKGGKIWKPEEML